MTFRSSAALGLFLLGCAAPPTPSAKAAESPSGGRLTASACEAGGGTVVGDIGDGAVHRPDYRCPASNQPPIGTIEPEPGGPIGVEGSVCCPG